MCNPSDFPPYDNVCEHKGVWCACKKYRSPSVHQYLGNQPQDGESGVLCPTDADRGRSRIHSPSASARVDQLSDSDGDGGYGNTESDGILTFDR